MVADVPFDEMTSPLNPYRMGMLVATFVVVHAKSRLEMVTRHCPVDDEVVQVWVKKLIFGYEMRTAITVAVVIGLPASSKT